MDNRRPIMKPKYLMSKQNYSTKLSRTLKPSQKLSHDKPVTHMSAQQIKQRRIIEIKELKHQKAITAKQALKQDKRNKLSPLQRRRAKQWAHDLKSGTVHLHERVNPDTVRPKLYHSKLRTRHQINKAERKAQPNPIKRKVNKMVDHGIARRERERKRFLALKPHTPKRNIGPAPQGPTM